MLKSEILLLSEAHEHGTARTGSSVASIISPLPRQIGHTARQASQVRALAYSPSGMVT